MKDDFYVKKSAKMGILGQEKGNVSSVAPNQPRIVHDPLKYLYLRTLQDTLQGQIFKVKGQISTNYQNCQLPSQPSIWESVRRLIQSYERAPTITSIT
jgi:hypothetical protein